MTCFGLASYSQHFLLLLEYVIVPLCHTLMPEIFKDWCQARRHTCSMLWYSSPSHGMLLKNRPAWPKGPLWCLAYHCFAQRLREVRCAFACSQGDNLFQLLGTKLAQNSGAYMVLAAAFMVPTVWLPDLKSLSYLGFVGISATLIVTATVAFTLLTGAAALRSSCAGCDFVRRSICAPKMFDEPDARRHVMASARYYGICCALVQSAIRSRNVHRRGTQYLPVILSVSSHSSMSGTTDLQIWCIRRRGGHFRVVKATKQGCGKFCFAAAAKTLEE